MKKIFYQVTTIFLILLTTNNAIGSLYNLRSKVGFTLTRKNWPNQALNTSKRIFTKTNSFHTQKKPQLKKRLIVGGTLLAFPLVVQSKSQSWLPKSWQDRSFHSLLYDLIENMCILPKCENQRKKDIAFLAESLNEKRQNNNEEEVIDAFAQCFRLQGDDINRMLIKPLIEHVENNYILYQFTIEMLSKAAIQSLEHIHPDTLEIILARIHKLDKLNTNEKNYADALNNRKVKHYDILIAIAAAKEYASVLVEIKKQIEQAQVEAITAINVALNKRNWIIGKIITEKQKEHKWGSNFLDNLAKDLQNMYPGNKGFSSANVYRMKAFYEAYEEIRAAAREFKDLPIFNIPWFHNVILLQKLKDNKERIWYAQKAIEYGWSRSMLETWIKSNLYKREGKAITNFSKTLPSPHSDMAQQSFKDPYVFDFLTLNDEHVEHDLERGLIDNVQKLLLEMGKGFALIGRQYHLEVDQEDYYIDLLFYHVKLKCYIVVELKARAFDPRDVGQINFYLSAVDDLVRNLDDKPTIGLLLCKTKKNFTAEYALRNITSPIGVAEYETEIMKKLPKELKSSLPTIEEIEAELEKKDILSSETEQKPIKKAKARKK